MPCFVYGFDVRIRIFSCREVTVLLNEAGWTGHTLGIRNLKEGFCLTTRISYLDLNVKPETAV